MAIVGAGPGGAATAAHLARAGLRVTVLDQAEFPRDKVCGDFLSPVALEELAGLGLPRTPGYLATNVARQAAVFVEGKRMLSRPIPAVAPLPDYGRVIPRKQLDAWILEAAEQAGARFIGGARVQGFEVEADGIRIDYQRGRHAERLRAPVAVAADGSSSVIARQLSGGGPDSGNRIVALRAYYDGVDGPADQADLYFSAESFPGYYWLFPTGARRANVGLGVAAGTIPRSDFRLRELLASAIRRDPALARRMRDAKIDGKVAGWPLATFDPGAPVVGDRLLLVGDAAGLINPLNGEGIQTALLSARWAAEEVRAALARGDLSRAGLDGYRRKLHGELRYDMALASFLVQCIRNRTLNPVWLQLLRIITARARRSERYAHLAGGILAGVVGAGEALRWPLVAGTVEQAAAAVAVGAFKVALQGRKGLARVGLDSARLGFTLMYDVARDPGAFARWAAGSGAGAAELLRQAGAHALARA